ncbi:acyl-CoA/acyl-ACP dehydrogenase [Chelatococcus sambhunathii]|uniref:Acyl-CoA/acyl-ACP dehydrogenase n=1 Tax=Chelatococcus sambhunathii TaxID=363953 RepID=A0ABU1DIJ8_9HYPH|nr:acyl-CoA/acyl-ACP dehydrogenase [Chelatococcus sambhunathii]
MTSALARRDDIAEALALVPPAVDERELVKAARTIATKIAAPNAADVDENARFPSETFAALKEAGLLGIMVPQALGGQGASVACVSEICAALAQACASSGMIYAMHQIKMSSLTVHCLDSEWHRGFMRACAEEQLLLASATTEGGGVGGDMRQSICGVQRDGDMFDLAKDGCLISYGAYADAILITARRTPDAPASDQVMAVMRADQYRLEKTGAWNTMGMRGTCSDNFFFSGRAPAEQIIPLAFADISAQSMLPYAHLLWASVWYGIASDAVARSEAFVRAEARKRPGATPPSALRLAELLTLQQRFKALVVAGIDRYERAKDDADELTSIGFGVAMNAIKISASQSAGEIVNAAFLICGIMGYRNDSPYSLARPMRDALSAPIMINNDRILGNVSNLLAVYKHDASLLR